MPKMMFYTFVLVVGIQVMLTQADPQLDELDEHSLEKIRIKKLVSNGNFTAALPQLIALFDEETEMCGLEHSDSLGIASSLAFTLYNLGKYEDSYILHEAVLATKLKLNEGEDSESTMLSKSNIVFVLLFLNRREEAWTLNKQVLEWCWGKLGPRHPYTLTARDQLARFLVEEGQYAEAVEAYEELLEDEKITFGPYHTNTLTSTSGLVYTLWYAGLGEEAIELGERVLDALEKVEGEGHPWAETTRKWLEDRKKELVLGTIEFERQMGMK